MSQVELARRLDTSPSAVNKLEAGLRASTIVTLEAVARALDVDLAELVREDGGRVANPPVTEPMLVEIIGALRQRDRRYLAAVRDAMKLVDHILAEHGVRPDRSEQRAT